MNHNFNARGLSQQVLQHHTLCVYTSLADFTVATILGDEPNMICHCRAKVVLERFTVKIQVLTRLVDLPPFATFKADAMTRRLSKDRQRKGFHQSTWSPRYA